MTVNDTDLAPEPFRISVDDAVIDDLRARLLATRWSDDWDNDDWRYGTPVSFLKPLVQYWLDEYDWRSHEAAMNAFEQFRVDIDGVPVHFLRVRGQGPSPRPLLLTHGWPWTFWDFAQMIGPLSNPAAYGADAADSFDLVIPSLPGFGFSSPLSRPGVGVAATADLWRKLMRDVLGYSRYGVMGADFGAVVSQRIAHEHPEDLIGAHLSRYRRPAAAGGLGASVVLPEEYAPDEAGDFERDAAGAKLSASHLSVHSADPQSLANALNDSPVGLASWIIERRYNWSDRRAGFESVFSRDDLITTVMIYWVTQTIGSSMRYYYETARENRPIAPGTRIDAPLAIGVLPADVNALPRLHAQQDTDLRQWTRFARGGHFGPAEVPELLVDDLRAFFRPLR
ncbi:MAG: epoxide hydrolase [Subtercola sp.]|nr:epoxide hydrolase [Subtercola sp.]